MAEFYPDGESGHRSEKLDIKWAESLIVQVGKNFCGDCRTTVKGAEDLICCPSPDCGIDWKQVIYIETIVPFRHRHLAMVGEAVLPLQETSATIPNLNSRYPQIGRRAVEDIVIMSNLL